MQSPNRVDDMTVMEPATYASGDGLGPDQAVLAELRKDLGVIVADLAKVVEERVAQAKAAAIEGMDQGLEAARSTIRTHPVSAIAVAALLGAGLAVALTSAAQPTRDASRLATWSPPTSRDEFMQRARSMQSSVSQSSTLSSLVSAFERVVESVSTIDPKSSLTPALEKAGTWLSGLRATMGGK